MSLFERVEEENMKSVSLYVASLSIPEVLTDGAADFSSTGTIAALAAKSCLYRSCVIYKNVQVVHSLMEHFCSAQL